MLAPAEEIDARCRQLITDHMLWYDTATREVHPHPCIHGDLTGIVPERMWDPTASFLTRAKQIDRAPLHIEQWCFYHGRKCPIFGANANIPDYDISGLPCPDMSRAGNRKYEEGATSSVFAAHAKMHIEYGTPMLVIENVWDRLPDNKQCLF